MTRLDLKVSPRASCKAVTGWMGDVLKVSVTPAPEHGKANAAVEILLAETLGLGRSAVRVIAGHTSKSKRVEIDGLDAAELRRRIDLRSRQADRRFRLPHADCGGAQRHGVFFAA